MLTSTEKMSESEDSGKKGTRKCNSKTTERKENNKKPSKSVDKSSPPSNSSKTTGHVSVPGMKSKETGQKSNEKVDTAGSTNDNKDNGTEVTMKDIMNCLLDVKNDQRKSNKRLDVLTSKVNEMYEEGYDEDQLLYGDDGYNQYDDNISDDNNNEPPSKRRKVTTDESSKNDNQSDQSKTDNQSDKSNASSTAVPSADSNDKSKECNGNFKAYIEKYKVKEALDKPVDSDLADLVNSFFQNGLPDNQLSELLKNTSRPENCNMLTKTRVNQLIWDLLSEYTRNEENKVQYRQNIMIKACILITKLVNQLNECKKESDDFPFADMINLGTDALGLLGHFNRSVNLARRDYQRPDLSDEYYHLCSSTVPYTEYLYGDDISKKVSDIDSVNKIGRKVRRGRGSGFRYGRRRFGRLGTRRGNRRGGLRGRFTSRFQYRPDKSYYDDKEVSNEDQVYPSRYEVSKNARRRFGRRGPRY